MTTLSVCVEYQNKHGWHVFTSRDIFGLYVAHPDRDVAHEDVPRSIALLLKLNHGIECVVRPKSPFCGQALAGFSVTLTEKAVEI